MASDDEIIFLSMGVGVFYGGVGFGVWTILVGSHIIFQEEEEFVENENPVQCSSMLVWDNKKQCTNFTIKIYKEKPYCSFHTPRERNKLIMYAGGFLGVYLFFTIGTFVAFVALNSKR